MDVKSNTADIRGNASTASTVPKRNQKFTKQVIIVRGVLGQEVNYIHSATPKLDVNVSNCIS